MIVIAEFLFFFIITLLLIVVNVIVVKVTGNSKKKRIISGVIVLLSSIVIFNLTYFIVGLFDDGGFATGLVTVVYTTSFVMNGTIIMIMGMFKTEP